MAWLADLLVFGTLEFWILIFISSSILIGFIEWNRGFYTTITFLLTLVVLNSAGIVTFSWVTNHPYWSILYVLGYLAVGTVWAIFKWWRFVVKLREKYDHAKDDFLRSKKISGTLIPAELRNQWKDFIGRSNLNYQYRGFNIGNDGIIPPNPNTHTEEIYLWIGFWPWSGLWFVVDEPVRKMVRAIYRTIRSSLVQISNNAFKGTSNDFQSEVTAKEVEE